MEGCFTCPVCLEPVAGACVTPCGHAFCGTCYYDLLERSRSPSCAVCRRPLRSLPYPCFEVDSALDNEDPHFRDRVRASRERANRAFLESKLPKSTEDILQSGDDLARCVALTELVAQVHSMEYTCEDLAGNTLEIVVKCANDPATCDEHTLAWRFLAHAATYFRDASVLLGFSVHLSAPTALVHPMATLSSRREITRMVAALSATHPSYFSGMLEPACANHLAGVAPEALAHVALALTPTGLYKLVDAQVLPRLLTWLMYRERVVAGQLLDNALELPDCGTAVLQAVGVMLHSPVVYAESLAKICWRDETIGRIIKTCHHGTLLAAVRLCAAGGSGSFEGHSAVIDMLQALAENVSFHAADLAVEVLRWMCQSDTDEPMRTVGMSYVSSCARCSEGCARAVLDYYGNALLDTKDEATLYLAANAFTHEALVEAHFALLERVLPTFTFEHYPFIYFLSLLSQTPKGAALVAEHALPSLRDSMAGLDEPAATVAQGILDACDNSQLGG
jgi:hypothetical protein